MAARRPRRASQPEQLPRRRRGPRRRRRPAPRPARPRRARRAPGSRRRTAAATASERRDRRVDDHAARCGPPARRRPRPVGGVVDQRGVQRRAPRRGRRARRAAPRLPLGSSRIRRQANGARSTPAAVERGAHRPGDLDRAGGVAVHADRPRRQQVERAALDVGDRLAGGHRDAAARRSRRRRAAPRRAAGARPASPSGVYARSANASWTVVSPASLGQPQPRRAGQAEHRQGAVVVDDRRDDGGRLLLVVHDRVVERAVRLHVAHPRARRPRANASQRADLVDDVLGQLVRLDVDEPAAEAGQVAVAHLRADRDVVLDRALAHPAHDRRRRRRGSRRRRWRW